MILWDLTRLKNLPKSEVQAYMEGAVCAEDLKEYVLDHAIQHGFDPAWLGSETKQATQSQNDLCWQQTCEDMAEHSIDYASAYLAYRHRLHDADDDGRTAWCRECRLPAGAALDYCGRCGGDDVMICTAGWDSSSEPAGWAWEHLSGPPSTRATIGAGPYGYRGVATAFPSL